MRLLLLLVIIGAAVACATRTQPAATLPPVAATTLPTSSASPVNPQSRATPTRASRTRPVAPARRPAAVEAAIGSGSFLTSTAYCETGLMANGQHTHIGAVAANRWPIGTRLRVSDSPYGPGVFLVEDRYGWGTQLDFATPGDCARARAWGRRSVRVEVLR